MLSASVCAERGECSLAVTTNIYHTIEIYRCRKRLYHRHRHLHSSFGLLNVEWRKSEERRECVEYSFSYICEQQQIGRRVPKMKMLIERWLVTSNTSPLAIELNVSPMTRRRWPLLDAIGEKKMPSVSQTKKSGVSRRPYGIMRHRKWAETDLIRHRFWV